MTRRYFKVGGRLVTKIFNASRFVLMQLERGAGVKEAAKDISSITEPLDCALVDRTRKVVSQSTEAFEKFDYAVALQHTEDAFWNFCDYYLELVKVRSYSEEDTPARRSAFATLSWSIKTFLRLFAPFLPYVTEEVWSWSFAEDDKDASVHTTNWPSLEEVSSVSAAESPLTFDAAMEVIGKIRGAKTGAQKSLKWGVSSLEVKGPGENRSALEPVLADVLRAGNVDENCVKLIDAPKSEDGLFEVVVALSESAPQ